MTAGEAIQNAYGEYWDKVKNNLTDSKWFKSKEVLGDFANSTIRRDFPNIEWECMDNYHPIYCYYFRPKSLQGIENNKDWIKIESEHNLPKETTHCWIRTIAGVDLICIFNPKRGFINRNHFEITHYQRIEKPQPPIF